MLCVRYHLLGAFVCYSAGKLTLLERVHIFLLLSVDRVIHTVSGDVQTAVGNIKRSAVNKVAGSAHCVIQRIAKLHSHILFVASLTALYALIDILECVFRRNSGFYIIHAIADS